MMESHKTEDIDHMKIQERFLSKFLELRDVYIANCKLQQKKDEEFEIMKAELSKVKEELFETKRKLEETQNYLESEREVKEDLKNLFRKSQKELEQAKESIFEKEEEIKELHDLILGQPLSSIGDESDDNIEASGSEGDSSLIEDASPKIRRTRSGDIMILPPIPEENPDEIGCYFEDSITSTFSLHFSFSSDAILESKSGTKTPNETPETSHVSNKIHASKTTKKRKIKTSASESSEKENSLQIFNHKPKKKKIRFSTLFNLAHF